MDKKPDKQDDENGTESHPKGNTTFSQHNLYVPSACQSLLTTSNWQDILARWKSVKGSMSLKGQKSRSMKGLI